MPPDQQPVRAEPTPADVGSVIEFGPAPASGRPARFSATRWAQALLDDRRLVPLAAGLGGVALFASLVSEWQVTKVDAALLGNGQVGTEALPATIADLGAVGSGYLAGVFALVATTVLVLFGPGPGRRAARLIGLSVGGVLIALLAAIGSELGDTSRLLTATFMVSATKDQVQLAYGRGLWCAVFGVAATVLALILLGRHLLPTAEDVTVEPAGPPAPAAPPIWSWRRPSADEQAPDEPMDLTVSAAKPFAPAADERDKPQ
jgi:hypothetical protein